MVGYISARDIHLFKIEAKKQRIIRRRGRLSGHRHFTAPNEPNGLVIYYYLKKRATDDVSIIITDPYGEEINRLKGSRKPGINRVVWNMRTKPSEEETERMRRVAAMFRRPVGKLVQPGEYVVVLQVGDRKFTQRAKICR